MATATHNGPLAVRDFRLLSIGQLTSTVGDYCYAVALPWLVLSTHGGPALLGAVLACYGIPRTVLIPAGGVLADKFGPRTVMLASDAIRCGLAGWLAILATRHSHSLVLLGPVAALLGAGAGAFIPASYSIMPTILRPEELPAGNSLSTAMVQLGSLTGPVLGGILVAAAGPAPALAVDAVSFAVSAIGLALIGSPNLATAIARGASAAGSAAPARPDLTPGPVGGHSAIAPGELTTTHQDSQNDALKLWPFLRQARLLQAIVLVAVVANITTGGTFEVALPALAHQRYGASGYGALIACFGGGMLVGTLAASRGDKLQRPAVVALNAFLVEAALTCLVPFAGLAGAGLVLALFGMCNGFGNIVVITLIQQWAPSQLLGRVMSLVMLAGLGIFPASVAIAGVLVRQLGPTPFFPAAGLFLAIAILGGLAAQEVRDLGAAAPAPAQAAELVR
ncbi:MAG TPA: MFS transporter [Streptosporangiaceae bacterium]|nr:MFS transporter [Streptosporangiaceae bacterium]